MNKTILATLLLLACACQADGGASTSIRVEDATGEQEDEIRLQEWRVERAVQEVLVRYGLEGLNVSIVIEEEGGLGETKPNVDAILDVTGVTVSINERLFLDEPPAGDDVLLGLFAHELAHALHYSKMSRLELVEFGERYLRFFENPEGHLKPWAAAYERFTDLTAIAYGFGVPLTAQKVASKDNVARHHPHKVWDFYLEPVDIRALSKDPVALKKRIDQALDVVNIGSLREFAETLPIAEAN